MASLQTAFDRRVATFATEVFLIAEWVAIVAGFIIAGDKLNAPIATGFGYALGAVASFYVGVRIDTLVAYARYKDGPREFRRFHWIPTVIACLVFGLGLAKLTKTMIAALA
jgi:hypothetical protein